MFHLPFAVSLFLGNVVSVVLTGFMVPWVAGYFGWWLQPAPGRALSAGLQGAALITALYVAMVLIFLHFF